MSHASSDEAAARAGADVELTAAQAPPELSQQNIDAAAVDAAQAALPSWDVQPEGLTRTVTTVHAGELQAAVREIAMRLGRLPELSAHKQQVVIRLAAAGGSLDQLVELAQALEPRLVGEAD